jgi:hypothetical protein
MAEQGPRRLVSEAEHGRAVLDMADAALDATATWPSAEGRTLRFGSTTVRICTRDPGVTLRPFSHLPAIDDGQGTRPDLVVHVCDGALPGGAGTRSLGGFHRVRDEHHFVAVTDGPPAVDALRTSDHVALSWVDDFERQRPHSRHRPLAEIFSAWFPTQGMLLLHAAAVGDDDGVVLVVGNGGSGKSTTAVLCTRAGQRFLGDDFCLLEPGPPPRVHSIHRSAKLRHASVHIDAALAAAPTDTVDGDRYFLVDEGSTVACAPVRAIVSVAPAPCETVPRLTHVDRGDALQLLLPTALKVGSGGDEAFRQWMRAASHLARTVDAYTLDLTWDTDRVVELVRDLG